MTRNRYVDFLRVLAIGIVVLGHWLDTTVTLSGGLPRGVSALGAASYLRWLTLPFQVMPVFFLAGGYAAAASWSGHRARGGSWTAWSRLRLIRLLRPTTVFVAVMVLATTTARAVGIDPTVLAEAGWGVAVQLWFLPVFLLLTLLTAPLLAGYNRHPLILPTGMVLAAGGVDVLVRTGSGHVIGYLNYLLVWGTVFLLGFPWWQDQFHRGPWVPTSLIAAGGLVLTLSVTLGAYPVAMVGVPGEPIANTAPPTVALLAFSFAQVGIVLALEPVLTAWLRRPQVWTSVLHGNAVVMTVYLWHMVPVVVLATGLYLDGRLSTPPIGSGTWWLWRLPWVGALGLLLALLTHVIGRSERPATSRARSRPPSVPGGPWWSGLRLVGCVCLTGYALFRWTVDGFAPTTGFPVVPLACFGAGLILLAWPLPNRA